MDLTRHIIEQVGRYWSSEVQILGAWPDGPVAVCVVHRRTVDPTLIIGHRFEFGVNSADGTVEGYARDIAINLAEPVGAARRSDPDRYGIVWVAFPEGRPAPQPPSEVVERISRFASSRPSGR